MDTTILGVQVYGPDVIGCKRHDRDIMVTFTTEPLPNSGKKMEFNDFFLTEEQARELMTQLSLRISEIPHKTDLSDEA